MQFENAAKLFALRFGDKPPHTPPLIPSQVRTFIVFLRAWYARFTERYANLIE
jgi:hypothetical protein